MAVDRDAVVDAALELAQASHWERVRLHDVAERLGCTLDDVRAHFREKEELIDAWLDRADAAMLTSGADSVEGLVTAWLDALAPYRRVTREMVLTRLEPGHLHHQLPSVLRISRTVQWMREAAGRDHAFAARAFDETACTTLCVAAFAHWLYDETPAQRATRERLAGTQGAVRQKRTGGSLPGLKPGEDGFEALRGALSAFRQRTRLRELSAEYRMQYAQLSQQMLELHQAAAEAALASDEGPRPGVRVRGETGNQLERLRFERDELSERARRQLRAILSDEQLQRVSGL
jgi:ubiquinone biosynthesis protein COQ9